MMAGDVHLLIQVKPVRIVPMDAGVQMDLWMDIVHASELPGSWMHNLCRLYR